jgi:hypothetical protein
MFNDSIFIRKISYVLDEHLLFKSIENLNYTEFMTYRNEFLQFAEQNNLCGDTSDAKTKHWSRIIERIKTKYSFVPPVSTSKSATEKRFQRMG